MRRKQILTASLFVLTFLGILFTGCGNQDSSTAKNPIQQKEDRWIIIEKAEKIAMYLDKQSITKNFEAGVQSSADLSKVKTKRRMILTCWIKTEALAGSQPEFTESIKKELPKELANVTTVTHTIHRVNFDVLTREMWAEEDIFFNGNKEIYRGKSKEIWESIPPGDLFEKVFDMVKKSANV